MLCSLRITPASISTSVFNGTGSKNSSVRSASEMLYRGFAGWCFDHPWLFACCAAPSRSHLELCTVPEHYLPELGLCTW